MRQGKRLAVSLLPRVLVPGILAVMVCLPVLAQERPSTSALACVRCHAAQATNQPQTPMARAIELPGANPTLKEHPKMNFRRDAYSYTVETAGDKSTYTVTDGTHTVSVPIRLSFGTGGQTWLLERDGKFYDSLVSYYPSISGLDVTMGEEKVVPHTVDEAMGRELGEGEAKACFGCHATHAVTEGKLTLGSMQTGVTCEHCHVGSAAHLLDAIQGEFGSAPPKLGRMKSEDISRFCGQCHRTWETVVRGHFSGEVNVRFQPYRLANSKCFDGADPRISCVACHDPHQDVVRQDSTYDSKCLACHGAATAGTTTAKACPVAKVNCVSCHMPKVNLPGGHMAFTDHEIRVVRAGEGYPD